MSFKIHNLQFTCQKTITPFVYITIVDILQNADRYLHIREDKQYSKINLLLVCLSIQKYMFLHFPGRYSFKNKSFPSLYPAECLLIVC